MSCWAMLCHAMLCYAMLCYAMLCYGVPCSVYPMPTADKKHCTLMKSPINAKRECGGAMPCNAMLCSVVTANCKIHSAILAQELTTCLIQADQQMNE